MMGCSGCNDTGGTSYNCHYVNQFGAGILTGGLMAVFVAPF